MFNRLDTTGEKIRELEDISTDSLHSEAQRTEKTSKAKVPCGQYLAVQHTCNWSPNKGVCLWVKKISVEIMAKFSVFGENQKPMYPKNLTNTNKDKHN